jgi:hypothetical protein
VKRAGNARNRLDQNTSSRTSSVPPTYTGPACLRYFNELRLSSFTSYNIKGENARSSKVK